MKTKYTLLTLGFASLAIAANPAMAADKASTVSGDQSWSSASSGDVTRVSKDRLENITTAQDILGSSVYDGAGEKIGDVTDISLGYKLQSMADNQAYDRTDDGSFNDGSQFGDRTDNRSSNDATQFGDRTDSRSSNDGIQASDRTGNQSSNYTLDDRNESNNEFSSTRQSTGGMANNSPKPYVFISVGGLLGFGDDVVRVPMSSLSRSDTEKDHLILQGYSKEKVVAIAEQEPVDFDADDYEYVAGQNETARAKRVWTDSFDTTNIREALTAEDGLGENNAAKIIVGRDGENVILSGSVNTESDKKKAGEIAKKNTEMTVKNEINVNKE